MMFGKDKDGGKREPALRQAAGRTKCSVAGSWR